MLHIQVWMVWVYFVNQGNSFSDQISLFLPSTCVITRRLAYSWLVPVSLQSSHLLSTMFFVLCRRRRAVVPKNDSWELETLYKTHEDLMGSVKWSGPLHKIICFQWLEYGHEVINFEVISIVNVEIQSLIGSRGPRYLENY